MSAITDRIAAIRDSLTLDYDGLAGVHITRFQPYRAIRTALDGKRPERVLEVGSSNGIISSFLPPHELVVTGDYPAADVCAMPEQPTAAYDAVILDQVLEHVPFPARAADEIYRVLKPEGFVVTTTPFLYQVHGVPSDYWRYTEDGLRILLQRFTRVETGSWGNRFTVDVCARHGSRPVWELRRTFRVLLRNEPAWPLVVWAIATK